VAAPTHNPADASRDLEATLGRIYLALFEALRRLIPPGLLERAIRTGSARLVIASQVWTRRVTSAAGLVESVERTLLSRGLRSGLREVPRTQLLSRVATLASQAAGPRAAARVASIDAATRQTITALISSAARSYRANPSLATLRQLAAEIKPLIGLTPKQAAQLRRRWRAMRQAGEPEAAIRSAIAQSADRMRAFRAKAIGERGVVEAISAGRHQAWVEARDAGEISPSAMKQWRDQGDERVRASHRAQSRMGPIPLDEVFPLHGVMYPPSPDAGCRCYHVLVDLENARAAPASARPAAPASTPEQRAARSQELQVRRAQFEGRRQELEAAALARQAGLRPSRPRTPSQTPGQRAATAADRAAAQIEADHGRLQRAWVYSSRSKTSIHFQEAMHREFGTDVATWNPKGITIDEALVERYRPVVRRMYEQTQAELRRQGVTEITLYRGVKHDATPLRGVLESWSSERGVAERFSRMGPLGGSGELGPGVVLEMRVEAWRIVLASFDPRWSAGRYGERFEFILLGGSGRP
jgi:hypothetical protein